MKKYVLFCLLTAFALCMTGCREDNRGNEPECKYHALPLNLTVVQEDWKWDDDGQVYYYHFDVPEITPFVYNYGNWSVSHEYNYGTGKVYQVALPETMYMVDSITEPSVVYYTQHIDFRISVGYVDIQVTNSDYMYAPENPETMYFRLQSNSDILDLTVQQEDWKFDEETQQYYYHFEVPEITSDAYDFGQWSISREYNIGTSDAYQVALPMSSYMTDTVQVPSAVHYSRHIDYAVGVGYVEIMLTHSDYLYPLENPEDMHFRLQLVY